MHSKGRKSVENYLLLFNSVPPKPVQVRMTTYIKRTLLINLQITRPKFPPLGHQVFKSGNKERLINNKIKYLFTSKSPARELCKIHLPESRKSGIKQNKNILQAQTGNLLSPDGEYVKPQAQSRLTIRSEINVFIA